MSVGHAFGDGQGLVQAGEDFGQLEVGEELQAQRAVHRVCFSSRLLTPDPSRTRGEGSLQGIQIVGGAAGEEDRGVADRELAGNDFALGLERADRLFLRVER